MGAATISQLPLASLGITGAEFVEIVQGGTSKRTTTQDIADLGAPTAPNGATNGQFLATLGGVSGTVTGSCFYTIIGTAAIIYVPVMLGTGNSTSMSLSGLPPILKPATTKTVMMPNLENAGVPNCLGSANIGTNGIITFALFTPTSATLPPIQNSAGFSAGGLANGINVGSVIIYDLN